MKSQDFSKKIVVALHEDLASWQLTNTVGHITAFLGNKMKENFDTGEFFVTKDGHNYPRNSQYAIVALKASENDLKELVKKLQGSYLLWIGYVQEMIDMIDDDELSKEIGKKTAEDMNLLGVGIFGSKEELKLLTGKLSLWK